MNSTHFIPKPDTPFVPGELLWGVVFGGVERVEYFKDCGNESHRVFRYDVWKEKATSEWAHTSTSNLSREFETCLVRYMAIKGCDKGRVLEILNSF